MNRATVALLILLTALLAIAVIASLGWRMEHDTPIMLYEGFLMKTFGVVPYRDLFDMNAPGTHLMSWLIYSVAHSSDHLLRLIDLLWIGGLAWLTTVIMRPFGRASAWAGAVLFPIAYLQQGVDASLQREVLALLPLVGAVAVVSDSCRWRGRVRYMAAGALVGVAATIKPQMLFALPVFLLADLGSPPEPCAPSGSGARRQALGDFGWLALGTLAVGIVTAVWLAAIGALGAFLRIATGYWPLYSSLSGDQVLLTGSGRLLYVIRGALTGFGQYAIWYVAAAFALTSLAMSGPVAPRLRRPLILLAGMATATWLGTAAAGKFWFYHWLPFTYFTIQLAVVALAEPVAAIYRERRWVPLAVMVLVLVVAVSLPDLSWQIRRGLEPPKHGRVDEIASFLTSNLRPGDTVQPLDWTGGAVHAMLLARARLATSFIYDFHFYHSVSTPYIRDLRQRFIQELGRSDPRYVVMVFGDRPWPQGDDTSRDFPQLKQMLQSQYHPVVSAETYTILERNGYEPGR